MVYGRDRSPQRSGECAANDCVDVMPFRLFIGHSFALHSLGRPGGPSMPEISATRLSAQWQGPLSASVR